MSTDPKILGELHTQLVERLNQLTSGDDWLRWLRSARVFHRYSPDNQLLLMLQGATGHVAGYRTWQRIAAQDGGHCQVRKGEHGLVIRAPIKITRRDIDEASGDEIVVGRGVRGFRPVRVFHEGQLVSPPDLPDQPLPQLLTGENRWQHVWAAVTAQLEDLGYSVELHTRSPGESWNGRTDFIDSAVEIMDDLAPPQRLKTLLHEWGHVALDHGDRLVAQRELQEVEAESVAYLVSATVGLDSTAYTVPYLASWARDDPKLLHTTAQQVLATTAEMIDIIEHQLSIEFSPDLLTLSGTQPQMVVTPLRPTEAPRPLLDGPAVIATIEPHPLPPGVPAELGDVFAALEPPDQTVLLEALDHLDRDLDIATALCADAGVDARRTQRLLLERGADPDRLRVAMVRPVVDHHGHQAPLFDDLGDPPDPAHRLAVVHRPAASQAGSNLPRIDSVIRRLADQPGGAATVAALTAAADLDPSAAVQVCAAAKLPPEFTAHMALARRDGDTATALADLAAGWHTTNGAAPDWNEHLPHPDPPSRSMSPAEAILAGWAGNARRPPAATAGAPTMP